MLGAIIGDTIGSVYEFHNCKREDFKPLFHPQANYTDDSIMTMAVADWLLNTDRSIQQLEKSLVFWATTYPSPMGGYGGGFHRWLFEPQYIHEYQDAEHLVDQQMGSRHPYNSWGNGSAMRCSACGWVANSLEETLLLAKRSAEITHNHPEGIKGAQATAAAIYLALHGESKEAIKQYVIAEFGYDLNHTCDEIRPSYGWESSCQRTVPPAIIAFLDSTNFESAIRLAVSLGGDSDTLACITGGIAQAFYKDIPTAIIEKMQTILPQNWWNIINLINLTNYEN